MREFRIVGVVCVKLKVSKCVDDLSFLGWVHFSHTLFKDVPFTWLRAQVLGDP